MFKKSILAIIFLLLLLGVFAGGLPEVRAQEDTDKTATPAASTPAATPNSSATSQLKKRLERILGDQDSEKPEGEIAGYMGEVTRVNEEALAVKTHASNHIIPLDETIRMIKNNRPLPVEDVSVGAWILAVGTRVKNGDVSPTTIEVLTKPPVIKEHFIAMGTITAVNRSSISFIPRGQTDPVTLVAGRNAKIIDSDGDTIALAKLPRDVSAVVVGFMEANATTWSLSTLKTTVGMEGFKGTPTPTPTPVLRRSTTPNASPSATLSPTR